MGSISRRNSQLQQKVEFLKYNLKPFIQYPGGSIHRAFPQNVMAYHLLTEDEIDDMAHFYHQSTPGPYSRCYPAPMNWDKDFLARTPTGAQPKLSLDTTATNGAAKDTNSEPWLSDLIASVEPQNPASQTMNITTSATSRPAKPYSRMGKHQRLRIKRRKFGKFIGFRNMHTPTEEIHGQLQASLDRAIERSRAELKHSEDAIMRRRKVG